MSTASSVDSLEDVTDYDSNAMGVAFYHIGWIVTLIAFMLYWLKFIKGQHSHEHIMDHKAVNHKHAKCGRPGNKFKARCFEWGCKFLSIVK